MGSDEVRRAAARVGQMGDDVRRLAERAMAADGVEWRSTAATAFRRRLHDEGGRIRTAATMLDDAATALLRHAVAIEPAGGPSSSTGGGGASW